MKKNYFILIALSLFFNFNLFSQGGPPWEFNGTAENFVASNYSQVIGVGTDDDGNSVECGLGTANAPADCAIDPNQTYLTYRIIGDSANPNLKNENANIDTSLGGIVAITMQNLTGNTRVQVITNAGSNVFTNFDGISANDTGFVTHYINVSNASNWTGTMNSINFRFKESASSSQNVLPGDILIDRIEILDAIPATPRIDYTFDDISDAEGFIGANGVTLSQTVPGELHIDIADQSPYPKLEQSGLYSVDADVYKYIQVTLVNNSTKNKLTFVSPSGGNQFSTTDMVINTSDPQSIEINLSDLTNWSGIQSSWWFQLVDNPGDGATASAGAMDIHQILFSEESTQEPVVTFPICEDFEGEDGAAGWTFIDAGGLETGWSLQTANGPSGQTLDHYYLPADAAYNDWAVSPSYDTSSLSDATVSYFEECVWCNDSEGHNVYYSVDYAGDATTATWVPLFEGINTDAEDVGGADLGVQSTYSIPSAESIVIAFNYVGTYGGEWNIDDVCIDGTLSSSDNEILDMVVYPNPVDGDYVTIITPVQGSKEIQVFSVTGRKLMDTTINGNTLDVSSLNSGFYMLNVTINGQSKVSKLVVR